MSQCQKIQYGVGYINTWQVNPGGTNRGSWSSTSITNNSSITCSIWFASSALVGNWRNLFHVGVNPFADFPRNPSFYIQAGGSQILWTSNWASGENAGYYSTIAHNSTRYNLIAVFNGTSLTMYLNGGSGVTVAINTPNNAPSTHVVWSPDTLYPGVSVSLNYLWFFPYPMTAAQVSSYYSATSSIVGSPPFVNTFTSPGSWTSSVTGNIKVLVVAGGGGGASGYNRAGGGGGAGGVVYCTVFPVVSGTSYPYTVGGGGGGGVGIPLPNGTTGSPSVFSTITALGGGGGGGNYNAGLPGGSGGGGAQRNYAGGSGTQPGQAQPANCTNYGRAGGVSGVVFQAGAGGGAGAVGGAQVGGIGVSINITGTAAYYGGGGGGAYQNSSGVGINGGAGGLGGGGAASQGQVNATPGTANTGGGGGGACSQQSPNIVYSGGNGGSGVVIIAYP
jgi:hypothetical protein